MKIETVKQNKQSGFTLVELAIVMIIIGLLIGGILKGQELIANSQVTATIAQVKGYDAAFTTFRDKYGATPGDMGNAQTRLPNCSGDATTNCFTPTAGGAIVNDNGTIDRQPGARALATITREENQAWVHLLKANLISGVEPVDGVIVGGVLPEAKVGGAYKVGFTANGALTGIARAGALTPGHYLVITGDPALHSNNAASHALTASQAAQIDRKLDDGRPATGTVQANGADCRTDNDPIDYAESVNNALCSPAIKIQG